jgi:hypothetical protein
MFSVIFEVHPNAEHRDAYLASAKMLGKSTTVTLIDGTRPPDGVKSSKPGEIATWLGFVSDAPGLVAWDVFDAVLTPGPSLCC